MRILVISTWFPYPPNQGSKTRAFHLIRALASRHELALVSFEDQPVQAQWLEAMREYCVSIEVVPRKPFQFSRVNTIQGWFSLQPSAVVAGYVPEMSAAVQRTAQTWKPDLVFGLTYVTAPYALEVPRVRRVMDVDNLLGNMLYDAYRQAGPVPERLRRYLAFWKFARYERSLFRKFDLGLVVSEADAQQMQRELPAYRDHIGLVINGVDVETHYPGLAPPEEDQLIFNGALTYEPNYDAMQFFLGEIFPGIRQQRPGVRLSITGRTEGVAVDRLPEVEGVVFTGYLDDIRPAVASSTVCVVPLRMGAGTRLKILEAMALGTPVVSTSKGAEGLDAEPETHLLVADCPEDFCYQTLRLLNDAGLRRTIAENAYRLVRERYDWRKIGAGFAGQIDRMMAKDAHAA